MYLAPKEERAGMLRSKAPPERVSAEIACLAERILSEQHYQQAEELARKFSGTSDDKASARNELSEMLQPPPLRPLAYAPWEAQFLPRWSRDTLRILGDFVYKLVKAAVYEKTGDSNVHWSSLKQAIDEFDRCWTDSSEVTEVLRSFHSTLYRDAEGEVRPLEGYKEHRFVARDAVLIAFVAMSLAEKITSISHVAQKARLDEEMASGK